MSQPVKYIFGCQQIAKSPTEAQGDLLNVLKKHNVSNLDTAWYYPGSEEALGALKTNESFTLDSKSPTLFKGCLKRQAILDGFERTMQRLNHPTLDIYYLHSPDEETSLEETLDTVQELYETGRFKRFGISNHSPEQVRRVFDCAMARGTVLPSVFQGNYNAVARRYETTLFPLLRELGMSFYAYSPLAGGFFAQSAQALREGTASGRFATDSFGGQMYNSLYTKPSLIQALEEWEELAKIASTSKVLLAYRWVAYHSALKVEAGDAMIIGASRPSQLEETLCGLASGPLPSEIVERIEKIWDTVADDAPVDNFSSFLKTKLKV